MLHLRPQHLIALLLKIATMLHQRPQRLITLLLKVATILHQHLQHLTVLRKRMDHRSQLPSPVMNPLKIRTDLLLSNNLHMDRNVLAGPQGQILLNFLALSDWSINYS